MRLYLSTLFLIFTFLCVAQNETSKLNHDSISKQTRVKKSRFVVFPGCDNEADKYECYANKLQDFIINNLSDNARDYLIKHAKNDTIVLYANVQYDKTGKTVQNNSRLLSFVSVA